LGLTATLGYTGLESVNPEGTVSKYVSAHAKHLINGNVLFGLKHFDISVNGIYKMRESAYSQSLDVELKPRYTVINLSVGAKVLKGKFRVHGEIMNLFDEKYSDILGAKMPSRWFNIGASVRL
jgi:iron complex outermembrane receptor protein